MSDLAEFLIARIAEDEEAAWGTAHWDHMPADTFDNHLDNLAGGYSDQPWVVYDEEGQPIAREVGCADAVHISRHDPARVLAECKAKRRIVEMADLAHERRLETDSALFLVLRYLALPYADHPDYDPAWRP